MYFSTEHNIVFTNVQTLAQKTWLLKTGDILLSEVFSPASSPRDSWKVDLRGKRTCTKNILWQAITTTKEKRNSVCDSPTLLFLFLQVLLKILKLLLKTGDHSREKIEAQNTLNLSNLAIKPKLSHYIFIKHYKTSSISHIPCHVNSSAHLLKFMIIQEEMHVKSLKFIGIPVFQRKTGVPWGGDRAHYWSLVASSTLHSYCHAKSPNSLLHD